MNFRSPDSGLADHAITALERAPFPILIHDADDGAVVFLNDAWASLSGYTIEDIPTISAWIDVAVESMSDQIESKEDSHSNGELVLRCKNGQKRTWLVSSANLGTSGDGCKLIACMADDVTEQRLAERKLVESHRFLDIVFEHIPNMVFVKDANELRFIRFNQAGEKLLGYRREELIGKNDYDFFPREQADFFVAKDRKVLQSGSLEDIAEEQIDTRERGQRILHTRKVPVCDEDGNPLYLLGISEDVTEKKEAQKALRQAYSELEQRVVERTAALQSANEQLKKRNDELDEFNYIASHDLKQPLRQIRYLAEYTLNDSGKDLPATVSADLEIVRDTAGRTLSMVEDLLTLSQAGRDKLTSAQLDLNSILAEVLEELSGKIEETSALVVTEELPSVHGDGLLVRQLYLNLIDNALKFCGSESPIVTLTVARQLNTPILGVKDNGIGIDSEYHQKVFSPFKRLHSPEKFEGTGIGLAICQRVVERHGGRLWVESNEGAGVHFRFTLESLD